MMASRLIRQARPSVLAAIQPALAARRFASDLPRSTAAPGQPIAPPPPFPPVQHAPPPPYKKRKAGFFKKAWRVTYISALAGLGWFTYEVYQNRHPGQQFEQDPSKKTIVILGSGWGSCALLKNIHAEDYNVVIVSPRN
jgi:NADH:ubiquinone reductase (non-electrogenic)